MGWSSALSLIDLGALLEASTDTVDGALAWLWLRRERAVSATVSLLAQAGSIVAIAVLRAVVQACSDVAGISRPSWVAIAEPLNALAVAAASLAITGAS